ncbi:hypothetical protein [Rhodoglobus sp.]
MKSFMLVWLYTSPHSWRGLPVPEAGPPVVVDGPNSRNILLCGSGVVVGYGVASHELALGGSLARSLAAITGRGTQVATIAGVRLSPKAAQSLLTPQTLSETDAVVLSFGTFDLLSFRPARTWGRRIGELVDSVLANTTSRTQVFVLDCTAPKMSTFTAAYQRRLLTLTSEYNEQIRLLVEQRQRVYRIDFAPEPEDAEAIEGRQNYRTWADAIAPEIAGALDGPGVKE